jgi:hypothetical protein
MTKSEIGKLFGVFVILPALILPAISARAEGALVVTAGEEAFEAI